jgi:hypothetical protein
VDQPRTHGACAWNNLGGDWHCAVAVAEKKDEDDERFAANHRMTLGNKDDEDRRIF